MTERRISSPATISNAVSTQQQSSGTRYRIADPILQVLSSEFDEHIIQSISLQLQEALGTIYGARAIEAIIPELKLSTSLCFYFLTILYMYRTPGQDMFGIHLLQEDATSYKKIMSGATMTRYRTLLNAPLSMLVKLSLLYAMIPYAYERRLYIASFIRHVGGVLISNDDEHDDVSSSSTSSSSTTSASSASSASSSASASTSQDSSSFLSDMMTICSRLTVAMARIWHRLAPDHISRIDLTLITAKEFYLLLFCMNGRFYELALQAFNICSLSTASQSRRRGMSWKIFGWLLTFRFSVLGIEGLRHLYRHYQTIMRESTTSMISSSSQHHMHDDDHHETISSLSSSSSSSSSDHDHTSMKCPLCMDMICKPAAMQCGHVYCWDCIVPWSQRQKRARGSIAAPTTAIWIKCPVCRKPCKQQCIRPIYL